MAEEVLQGILLDATRVMPWQAAPRGSPFGGPPGGVASRWGPAGAALVAAGTEEGTLYVWSPQGMGEATWQLCCVAHQAQNTAIPALAFTPDGRTLAVTAGEHFPGLNWAHFVSDYAVRADLVPEIWQWLGRKLKH